MKISVAMACYNSAAYIEDAIKSIVDQTHSDWHLSIVDDGSTDSSLAVMKKCIKRFKIKNKVKITKHSENFGYGRTLRDAIAQSSGELVAIVDSDDALADKDTFKIVIEVHTKHPKASMTYSNYTHCNKELEDKRNCPTIQIEGNYLDSLSFSGSIRISHLKVFKRKLYDMTEGVNPNIRRTVDKDIVLKLEEVGKLIHIDKSLYYFRNHPQQLGYTFPRHEAAEIKRKILIDARKRREAAYEHICRRQ